MHRTATRVLRPAESNSQLNYGLGTGEATIVAHGNLDGLGDIKGTLKAWGLGANVVRPKMRSWIQ
jgi:processing peptidase subunit alpha